MFENVPASQKQSAQQPPQGPQQQPAQSQVPPPPQPTGTPPSVHTTPTYSPQPQAQSLGIGRTSTGLFQRTGLTRRQKLLLLVITIVVLVALIGGGVWLYVTLQPFSARVQDKTDETTNTTNVPIHELDTDKDGVRDIDERRYSSNPEMSDSDGDALNDYLEIYQYKTNPIVADTDGDGYVDGNEVENGYDPNGPGRLEP